MKNIQHHYNFVVVGGGLAGICAAVTAASTTGEHPTVFSLKSRRKLSLRPCVGGEYGRILLTLCLGRIIAASLQHFLHGLQALRLGLTGPPRGPTPVKQFRSMFVL